MLRLVGGCILADKVEDVITAILDHMEKSKDVEPLHFTMLDF